MNRLGPFSENTIVVGDCLDIMAQMPDGCVDLVVTDPPYGIAFLSNMPKFPRDIHIPIAGDDGSIWRQWPLIMEQVARVMMDDAGAFFFTRWDKWADLDVSPLSIKNMIVWDKGYQTMGDLDGNYGFAHELLMFATKGRPKLRWRRIANVWRIERIAPQHLRHPTEKPESLIVIAVETMSDPGDLIFDPFMGSGTTAVVADRLGRNFFGCDINPDYVEMALKRLEKDRAGRQLNLL